MTMVSSGPISIGGSATTGGLNQSINIELGRSATASSNLNESALRTLAGVPSGTISLSNFYGKSSGFAFTISTNQSNANLRTLAVSAGWNQTQAVIATINPGVQIRSTAVGTPALTINGSWPGGVRLNNNGVIIGQGGAGGQGGNGVGFPVQPSYRGIAGFAGGTALTASVPVTIQNSGTIGGGGGGGGGGGYFEGTCDCYGGQNLPGGGGGGGAGFGAGGIKGRNSAFTSTTPTGSAGGQLTGGAGGRGECSFRPQNFGGAGGSAGVGGAIGPRGGASLCPPGVNFFGNNTSSGGAAGPAVTGNSFISWAAFGTRLGPIS